VRRRFWGTSSKKLIWNQYRICGGVPKGIETLGDHTMRTKILLLEDNSLIQQLLQHVLEAEGYEVIVADDGMKGLEILQSVTPQIIITDLAMPIMRGDSFVEYLRNRQEWKTIPVLIVSAGDIDSTIETISSSDHNVHIIEKSAGHKELVRKLRSLQSENL
jgi:DNA-binding response OmpR family regulator